jgi:hypothetical protein
MAWLGADMRGDCGGERTSVDSLRYQRRRTDD